MRQSKLENQYLENLRYNTFNKQEIGIIIDAAPYFRLIEKALTQAEHRVFIVGWDLHSQVILDRHGDKTSSLQSVIHKALKNNPNLHIYFLIWEYSPIYFMDRELFQKLKFSKRFVNRVHYVHDSEHPLGGSQHQKLVVIDDNLGFSGGIDLASNRWDRPEHATQDSHRQNPDGDLYQPFHDMHSVVTGEPARALCSLVRERWMRATGEILPDANPSYEEKALEFYDSNRSDIAFSLKDASLNLKLTFPSFKKWPSVRDVEESFCSLIDSASSYIYIENQYFTSEKVKEALIKKLKSEDPPEVIILLPEKAENFFEKNSMEILEHKCLKELKSADKNNNLQVYCPIDTNLPKDMFVKIHSKLMIVDSLQLRIGSSNLNNRSMGLDSECDWLVSYSEPNEELKGIVAHEIAHFYDDVDTSRILDEWRGGASLKEIIAGLNESKRTKKLAFLDRDNLSYPELANILDKDIVDWEEPLKFEKIIDKTAYGPDSSTQSLFKGSAVRILAIIAVIALITVGMSYIDFDIKEVPEQIKQFLNLKSESTVQNFLLGVLVFTISACLFVPLNLLIITYASMYDSVTAFTYIMLGSAISSIIGYLIGRTLSQKLLGKFFPKEVLSIGEKIKGKHILPLILVRLAPVAPYNIVNILAGSFKVSFKLFVIGTVVGILPGSLSLIFFQSSLFELLDNPSAKNIGIFAISILVLLSIFYLLKKRLSHSGED